MMRVCSPCLIVLAALVFSPYGWADPAAEVLVRLIETEDSVCLAHGGNMVSLQLADTALPLQEGSVQAVLIEVWVDRWFMQVQTADHTRHLLTADAPEAALGCSHSIAGPQHWTLSRVKRLPTAGAPFP